MAIITYKIRSYKADEAASEEDDQDHAVTGDGFIAHSLFQDLVVENPDRVYVIEAYTDFVERGEDAKVVTKDTDEGVIELVVYIRGNAKEEDYDIVYFDEDHPHLDEAVEALGMTIDIRARRKQNVDSKRTL